MLKWIRVGVAGAVLLVPAIGIAQSRLGEDEHHAGWAEAVAACKDKADGDACEFEGHHGKVVGACHKARSGDLVCMGPHHHHDHDGGAP